MCSGVYLFVYCILGINEIIVYVKFISGFLCSSFEDSVGNFTSSFEHSLSILLVCVWGFNDKIALDVNKLDSYHVCVPLIVELDLLSELYSVFAAW